MRKQGIWVKRFIFLILFVFVMSFMSYHVVNALTDPVGKVTAVIQTVESVTPLDGWFVRDEMVIAEPVGMIWEVTAQTGQRLAKDDTLALTYQDAGALRTFSEIRALTERLAQLETINRYAADPVDVREMDEAIQNALIDLLSLRDSGVLDGFAESGDLFRSLLYKRSYIYEGGQDIDGLIADLREQIDDANARASQAQGIVTAPVSGVYCGVADGYETVLTPESLDTLTVPDFLSLAEKPAPGPGSSMGRLARGFTWYYIAAISQDKLGTLGEGSALSLRVDKGRIYDVCVSRIVKDTDGTCLLILACDQRLSEIVDLRQVQCEIFWNSLTGLRIPREAVRISEEGQAGVYCLIFNQQKFKPVNILLERDNYYLVSYEPETSGALLPGDEVIVRGKNLHDGKVLRS